MRRHGARTRSRGSLSRPICSSVCATTSRVRNVQSLESMRLVAALVCALGVLGAVTASAQEPPPKIGPFVVDLHGTVPRFPEDLNLADSRGIQSIAELPGSGLGIQIGVHLYLVKWRAITIGIGGEFTSGRSTQTPPE